MRTLSKFTALAVVAALILVSGCATNHTTMTQESESRVTTTDTKKLRWQDYVEYSLLPLTIAGWMFGQAESNPGIPSIWK